MSRIGKKIIDLPSGVTLSVKGQDIEVSGPKGKLKRTIHNSMSLTQEGNVVSVVPKKGQEHLSNFHGLTRSLVMNMVSGVHEGFSKSLLLKGVGYRALLKGKELHLTLGYSHPIIFSVPEGIEIKVEKQGKDPMVVVRGIDKESVGQTAANIRGFRKPEPYHGKGVRYIDEVIITKVGKSAGKK